MLLICVLTWVTAGLPQKGHVTTALDLPLIIKSSLQTAEFRRIVAKKDYPWSYF
jgi:D-alanyl-D-alanine carboxypeptidase